MRQTKIISTHKEVVHEQREELTIKCCLCDKIAPDHDEFYELHGEYPIWGNESCWDEIVVIGHFDIKTNYPEGSSGYGEMWDICPKCYKEKVVPALKKLGAKSEKTKWDTY